MDLPYELTDLLRLAYSAEKAAAFAYQGHAGSVKDESDKIRIKEIEDDEWVHREEVLHLMKTYEIPVSRWYEIKYHVIGKAISGSCYVIGWFMPMYFAGRLESGNVNEYYHMVALFHTMGIKEKEHELYFLSKIRTHRLLPVFEKIFSWGATKSFNDIDI